VALGCSFAVMAILLAETLITLGAAAQRWCQGQETWVPLSDAIAFQPPVVPVVEVRVIKPLSHSCHFGVGVSGSGVVGVEGAGEALGELV
jgi:hypothetical protein